MKNHMLSVIWWTIPIFGLFVMACEATEPQGVYVASAEAESPVFAGDTVTVRMKVVNTFNQTIAIEWGGLNPFRLEVENARGELIWDTDTIATSLPLHYLVGPGRSVETELYWPTVDYAGHTVPGGTYHLIAWLGGDRSDDLASPETPVKSSKLRVEVLDRR